MTSQRILIHLSDQKHLEILSGELFFHVVLFIPEVEVAGHETSRLLFERVECPDLFLIQKCHRFGLKLVN